MTTAAGHALSGDTPKGTQKQMNAWQQPGPAAFDFRSDTITTPNASMLDAIVNTTLMDDVFTEDPTTIDLEASIARLSGHEAGLLVMSGTMGNQVALRAHLSQPPHSVLADIRGHIVNYEAGGVSSLSQAMLIPIRPSNGHHLTLADVQAHTITSDDVHACPTKVISLENTLNGMVMPLAECKAISQWARKRGIILHLDGARLWECVAADAGTLPEFTELFDSVSLCFSKGLGAPIGSIIVGSKSFIKRARHVRKAIGGGTRQSGIIAAAARVAIEEGFGQGPKGENGKLRATHQRAKRIEKAWVAKGGQLSFPVETNMVWLDLDAESCSANEFASIAKEEGIKARGGRLVVHYQITDEAEEKLYRVMDKVLSRKKAESATDGDQEANGHVYKAN